MKKFIQNIKNCSIYFIAFGAVLVCLSSVLIVWSKAEIHLWINQFHAPFFDQFFKIVTFAGTGISLGLTVLILLFIKYKHAIALLSGYAIGIGIVQLFKHVLISAMYRPTKYFEELGIDIYTVDGLKHKTLKGFPSGHTTEIFCVITFLALLNYNRTTNIILLFVALLVGFSRVYLSQHFLQDVYGGAVLGTVCALVSFTLFQKNENKDGWLNRSILTH